MNTHPSTTDLHSLDLATATPEAIVAALEEVIADVNTFLADFCVRVGRQSVPAESQDKPNEAKLRRAIEDLKVERDLWEARKQNEEARIQEKIDQLSAAWLRLEEEQRAFLQMTQGNPTAAHRAAANPPTTAQPAPTVQAPSHPMAAPSTAAQPVRSPSELIDQAPAAAATPSQLVRTTPETRPVAPPVPEQGTAKPREDAVLQFQRLRQEIESSRPKSGQH